MTIDTTIDQVQHRSSRQRRITIDNVVVVDSSQAESSNRPTVAFDLSRNLLARDRHLGRSGTLTLYKKLGLTSSFEIDDRLNPSLARGKSVTIDIKVSNGTYQRFFTGFILESHYDGDFKTDIKISDILSLKDFPSSVNAIGLTSVKGPQTVTAPAGATIESVVALYNTVAPVSSCPIPAVSGQSVFIPGNTCTYGVSLSEVTAGSLNQSRISIVVKALEQAGIPSGLIQLPVVASNGGEQCVRVAPYGNFNTLVLAPPGKIISSITRVAVNSGADYLGNAQPDCPIYPAGGSSLTINVPSGCQYDVCYGTSIGSQNGLSDQLNYTAIKNAGDSLVSAAQKILTPTLNWLWVDSLGIVRISAIPSTYTPSLSRVSGQIDSRTRNEHSELVPSIVRSYGTVTRKLYSQFYPGGVPLPGGEQSISYYGQAYLPALQLNPYQEKINEFSSEYCTSGDQHASIALFELNHILAMKNGRPYVDEARDELFYCNPFTVILVDGIKYFIDGPTWTMANDEFIFTANLLFIENGNIPTTSGVVTSGGFGGSYGGGGIKQPVRADPSPGLPTNPATPPAEPQVIPTPPPADGQISSFCADVALTFNGGPGQSSAIAAGSTFTLQTLGNGQVLLNGVASAGISGWNNSVFGGWSTGACAIPAAASGDCISVDPGQAWTVPAGKRVASATPINFGGAACPVIPAGGTGGGTTSSNCGYIICFENIPGVATPGISGISLTWNLNTTGSSFNGTGFASIPCTVDPALNAVSYVISYGDISTTGVSSLNIVFTRRNGTTTPIAQVTGVVTVSNSQLIDYTWAVTAVNYC
jgi:hypothetical protein